MGNPFEKGGMFKSDAEFFECGNKEGREFEQPPKDDVAPEVIAKIELAEEIDRQLAGEQGDEHARNDC